MSNHQRTARSRGGDSGSRSRSKPNKDFKRSQSQGPQFFHGSGESGLPTFVSQHRVWKNTDSNDKPSHNKTQRSTSEVRSHDRNWRRQDNSHMAFQVRGLRGESKDRSQHDISNVTYHSRVWRNKSDKTYSAPDNGRPDEIHHRSRTPGPCSRGILVPQKSASSSESNVKKSSVVNNQTSSDNHVRKNNKKNSSVQEATSNLKFWRQESHDVQQQKEPQTHDQIHTWKKNSNVCTTSHCQDQKLTLSNPEKCKKESSANPQMPPQKQVLKRESDKTPRHQEKNVQPTVKRLPDTQEASNCKTKSSVTMAVVMKQLAQRYNGYLEAQKSAELLQLCSPEFLSHLNLYINTMKAVDAVAFLNDLLTFLSTVVASLPSSTCVKFVGIFNGALRLITKNGNVVQQDRYARLKEKFLYHTQVVKAIDALTPKCEGAVGTDFRSTPVLQVDMTSLINVIPVAASVHPTVNDYLSKLFMSLFKEYVGKIYDGIRDYLDTEHNKYKLKTKMQFYVGVRFENPVLLSEKLCLVLKFPSSPPDLLDGSLVCLSSDGFSTVLYAIVAHMAVRLCGQALIVRDMFHKEYVMINTGLLAEPSCRVLRTLQQMEMVPMHRYIIEGATEVRIPKYLKEGAVVTSGEPQILVPTREVLGLDTWQHKALKYLLKHELSLVVGPSGSGKTHLALKAVSLLPKPVLVISTKNCLSQNIYFLADRSGHDESQLRRIVSARKTAVLVNIKKLELDLKLLSQRNGVVSLESLREYGVVSDKHFRCFLVQPDTYTAYYSWLVDESDKLIKEKRRNVVPDLSALLSNDDLFSEVHPTLKWSELLDNMEKKRAEVKARLSKLQDQWGQGCPVTKEMLYDEQERYHQIASTLKRLKSRLESCWTDNNMLLFHDVWMLKPSDRWKLYFTWERMLRARILDKLTQLQTHLVLEERNLEQVDQEIDFEKACKATAVAVTVEEALRLRPLLQKLAPKAVIVDDATNVTESQLVTCIPDSCQHLILLGGTKSEQGEEIKQGTSGNLMSRLIDGAISVSELKLQHRMQPQLASLMMAVLYPELECHNSVTKISKVKGIDKSLFFINHEHPSDKVSSIPDYRNVNEAHFLLALCHHLILQGYTVQDIVMLTTYTSQRNYIREECENSELLRGIQVHLVEEFGGRESKIVLLSLVEACSKHDVGLMLSRAQEGLYIIGNLQQLRWSSVTWKAVEEELCKHEAIGKELMLRCQVHPDQTTSMSSVECFSRIPEGGCTIVCNYKFKCGHLCNKQCHVKDQQHITSKCMELQCT